MVASSIMLCFSKIIRTPHIARIQCMSQYPSHFIEPVYKKSKQGELEKSGEISSIAHVPVKAAKNDQTDSVFHDDAIAKFTNYVMKGGNKTLARELVEKTFEHIKRTQIEKYHKTKSPEDKAKIITNPRVIFSKAIENCQPVLGLTPIKRGGATYQVPVPITQKRSRFLSMKWLVEAANEKERTVHFPEKMAWELIEAANNTGRVVKRKQDLHKQCEANRAYAHYRWS
ncbi:28S ribosomal protein S7, mitochondrial [Chrysoperla carnea]|uniref:28S ribosomal protein S7, mitochondrial n=1 Tax=Chrysoperla carnea TaxID=189513 RepID=UPI001D078968|nr:28S ribosomal protein S7, mitochondrial [Chrysoperla carnea]